MRHAALFLWLVLLSAACSRRDCRSEGHDLPESLSRYEFSVCYPQGWSLDASARSTVTISNAAPEPGEEPKAGDFVITIDWYRDVRSRSPVQTSQAIREWYLQGVAVQGARLGFEVGAAHEAIVLGGKPVTRAAYSYPMLPNGTRRRGWLMAVDLGNDAFAFVWCHAEKGEFDGFASTCASIVETLRYVPG